MNQEQFQQFWLQLKGPLQTQWSAITETDVRTIDGQLVRFGDVLQQRYGEVRQEEVRHWADRRYAHWTGNYLSYPEAKK